VIAILAVTSLELYCFAFPALTGTGPRIGCICDSGSGKSGLDKVVVLLIEVLGGKEQGPSSTCNEMRNEES
jgi:ABC-type dipeptide/oligopeptide/nickel transport system ATPase subunit